MLQTDRRICYFLVTGLMAVFVVYHLLASFNQVPFFLSGQDTIILLILLVGIFLQIMVWRLEKRIETSENIPYMGREEMKLEIDKYPGPELSDFPEIKELKDHGYLKYLIALQNYFKGSHAFKQVMDKLLVSASRVSGSERASILLHDEKSDELYIYRTLGWSSNELKIAVNTRMKPGEGISGRVFIDGFPLLIKESSETTDIEFSEKYRTQSFISFPIFSGNRVIGVLNLTEKIKGTYSERDIDIVTFIINEIAAHLLAIKEHR